MPGARVAATQVENEVARWLRDQGWTILTRRYKADRGEIDIVALDGEMLVFVEVKSTSRDPEYARTALTADKLARLRAAGAAYLYEAALVEQSSRIDLVVAGPAGFQRYEDVTAE